jgi:hypothetical protein
MAKTVTAAEVYRLLQQSLRSRSDLGMRKAVADRILDSPNPFDSMAKRGPQRWFVLVCAAAVATVASFLYFNFWQ